MPITALRRCAMVAAACFVSVSGTAHAAAPAFEPIDIERINLPPSVKEAATPVYAKDGKHFLFYGNLHLWIAGTDGKNAKCLSCGVANEPPPNSGNPIEGQDKPPPAHDQPGMITPFPDGKRVFFGPYAQSAVLECTPSVVNCKSKKILPVDYSTSQPASIPPGGAVAGPTTYVSQVASPKLSPDGKYVGWSDARTDAIEVMVLAKLTRVNGDGGARYTTTDARVLNPQGPKSTTDPDVDAWSQSSGLFEFKTFVDGGRAITYVQVGGDAGLNPNIWKLDLATGKRTRLTSYPDWDEDMAFSPDNKWMMAGSARTLHLVDSLGGLLPFRSFFDAPMVAQSAGYFVGSAERRRCDPFNSWILPSTGDDGGDLIGQPLAAYKKGSGVLIGASIQGWPMWSRDSTRIALTTIRVSNATPLGDLLVAKFRGRKPTKPMKVGSSKPGAWAPTQEQYHGALGANADITLQGKVSGSVVLHLANTAGALASNSTATYINYSDDGKTFLNGTQTSDNPGLVSAPGHFTANLKLTGARKGSLEYDITFGPLGNSSVSGKSKVTYDGTTLTGPRNAESCPNIENEQTKRTPLDATANRTGNTVRVKVTAAMKGAGANQRGTDRRLVRSATVRIGRKTARTNAKGIAVLRDAPGERATVSAGQSFKDASVKIR